MKLLIQPDEGPEPLLRAIGKARKSVEIAIFRFDRAEIEGALKAAVGRGVAVTALIAYTNRGGEVNLRKLEMRLLAVGVAVSRTADDLLRYHDKIMIVDRRLLYVLSFNFTHLDIDHSRGFGIITSNLRLVQEAAKLFEADSKRIPFKSAIDKFVVSPVNARQVLGAFIRKARKELLIYDPKIADQEMLRALKERSGAGVKIQIIGRVAKQSHGLQARKLGGMRLHTRTIIRDRRHAFVGSQSLRTAELDSRREVGLIIGEAKVVNSLAKIFEADWKVSGIQNEVRREEKPPDIKKTAKTLVKELSPLSPVVKAALKQVESEAGNPALDPQLVKQTVKEAVKEAVKERVNEVVKNTGEES